MAEVIDELITFPPCTNEVAGPNKAIVSAHPVKIKKPISKPVAFFIFLIPEIIYQNNLIKVVFIKSILAVYRWCMNQGFLPFEYKIEHNSLQ